jgi:hypothetical protein
MALQCKLERGALSRSAMRRVSSEVRGNKPSYTHQEETS